jgi:molecular chaperone HtpG
MAKKQFKSESKRLLDLMVNSIYTHKEIFLREIISNASDAIDKLCYISLTDDQVGLTREDFKIGIAADKEKRTLTVSDNGIGMTKEELESNLGVIARSGSEQFKKNLEEKPEDIDIIGQFGVGFYSAFMVASTVTVVTKAYGNAMPTNGSRPARTATRSHRRKTGRRDGHHHRDEARHRR